MSELTPADVAYVRESYRTLEELCANRAESVAHVRQLVADGILPRASYVLPDGTELFPEDYFRLLDEAGGSARLRDEFLRRIRNAVLADATKRARDAEEELGAYLAGIYGICLRNVTPETIVRKGTLVRGICELLVLAEPDSEEWRRGLRAHVDELDALEREFSPDYDRSGRFGRPPTRDLLIAAARGRFPDVFE